MIQSRLPAPSATTTKCKKGTTTAAGGAAPSNRRDASKQLQEPAIVRVATNVT